MKLCPIQDMCLHYDSGSNKPPNHHIRLSDPCRRWLALDCEKIALLAELLEFATGDIMACDVGKINRLKEKFKDTLGG